MFAILIFPVWKSDLLVVFTINFNVLMHVQICLHSVHACSFLGPRTVLLLILSAAQWGGEVSLDLHCPSWLWEWSEVPTMRLLVVSCASLVSSFTLNLACLLLMTVCPRHMQPQWLLLARSSSCFLTLFLFALFHTRLNALIQPPWSCLHPPHLTALS